MNGQQEDYYVVQPGRLANCASVVRVKCSSGMACLAGSLVMAVRVCRCLYTGQRQRLVIACWQKGCVPKEYCNHFPAAWLVWCAIRCAQCGCGWVAGLQPGAQGSSFQLRSSSGLCIWAVPVWLCLCACVAVPVCAEVAVVCICAASTVSMLV
jgi:hypothetical protein